MLRATAQGEDAATLQALAPVILQDHKDMDAMWQDLHEQLSAIADGSGSTCPRPPCSASCSVTRTTWSARKARWRRWPCACSMPSRWRSWARPCSAAAASANAATPAACEPAAPADRRARGRPAQGLRPGQPGRGEVADDPIAQFTRWFEKPEGRSQRAECDERIDGGRGRPAELAHRAGQAVRRTRFHLVHQLRQPERKAACQQSFCSSAILLERT
jgi:hypothetical protein